LVFTKQSPQLRTIRRPIEAQVKPFKVEGKGNGSEGLSVIGGVSPYTMSGKATLLGKYSPFDLSWQGLGLLNFPQK
jgi:hypothetical protein